MTILICIDEEGPLEFPCFLVKRNVRLTSTFHYQKAWGLRVWRPIGRAFGYSPPLEYFSSGYPPYVAGGLQLRPSWSDRLSWMFTYNRNTGIVLL